VLRRLIFEFIKCICFGHDGPSSKKRTPANEVPAAD